MLKVKGQPERHAEVQRRAGPAIDGANDTEFIRSHLPERRAMKEQQGIVNPDSLAEAYWRLHRQAREACKHKDDLPPPMGLGWNPGDSRRDGQNRRTTQRRLWR